MDLKQLTRLEEAWLERQRHGPDDRETFFERMGVYMAWRDIFSRYVALAKQGRAEALKRALYLAWCEESLPPLVTGIKDLPRDRVAELLAVADQRIRNGRLDAELSWMLPYYQLVEPSWLDRFEDLDALRQASRERPFRYRRECLDSSFKQRGQMGEYWTSKQNYLRSFGGQRRRPKE